MDVETLVTLRNIWKIYGKRAVLRGVNLNLEVGDVICIYGENGVGKTTLLKIISGLIKPSKGSVFIMGSEVWGSQYKNLLGVLLHENILYEELTIRENLEYYGYMYGLSSDGIYGMVEKLINIFGLDKYLDTRVSSLSYGWRKRANIVRALLNNPKIVLLDEPFIGLDVEAANGLMELLISISMERGIIFTLSNIEDVNRFRDIYGDRMKFYVLKDGVLGEL